MAVRILLACFALLAAACASNGDYDPAALVAQVRAADPSAKGASNETARSTSSAPKPSHHRGPAVHVDDSGPARFTRLLHTAFDSQRAMESVRFIDGHYRAPANDGYEAVLAHLEAQLREAGFGGADARLQLDVLATDQPVSAWTPRSGSLHLLIEGAEPRALHVFAQAGDRDRVLLPVNTPSCAIDGPVALSLDELAEGEILVTQAPSRQVKARAYQRGAAAVVSASLESFNVDPSGRDRHLDAIQYRVQPEKELLPIFQISQRSYAAIAAAVEGGAQARLALRAEVELAQRPLRTLVATIVGAKQPDEAVVTVSHVQEPGACDNASGVAGLLESARSLAGLLKSGRMAWPERSLVFLWGDEFRQSRAWLDSGQRRAIAGLSSDMTGQSREQTGAILLLERMPDPGALVPLDPDAHTPWGKGEVRAEDIQPSGLAVIARCAIVDVGGLEGDWHTADHPWEGGSDHDVFIERGLPAALFWHFTDFAYHTSLDRLEHVDAGELKRTAIALSATALAVADPRSTDLDRYVRSLRLEENLRVKAAEQAEQPELAQAWREWCVGARHWLRALCLDLEPKRTAEASDPAK